MTLARMARAVGVSAQQLRAAGRDDAADELDALPTETQLSEDVENFVRRHVPPARQDAAIAMLRALISEDPSTTGDRKIG